MSAETSSGPVFTQVRLVGPLEEVDRLMAVLSGAAEVIFDSPSKPDARGEVERVAQVVGHPVPRPVAPEHGAQVTVQVVLEADGAAFAGREQEAAAREMAESVTRSLQSLPHVRQVSSRVISLWGLPAVREQTAVAGVGGAEARLDAAGVSLWLTDWKVDGGGAWSGRRVMALVGGEHAGHLDVYVHPDGQAVDVAGLEVEPGYQDHPRQD